MARIWARPPYAKRDVPGAWDSGWVSTELGNIQRAIPPTRIVRITGGLYTPTVQDAILLINATAAAVTIDLQDPSRQHGLVLTLKRIDATANAVTLTGTVDGVVNPTIVGQYHGMQIFADETGWYKISTI